MVSNGNTATLTEVQLARAREVLAAIAPADGFFMGVPVNQFSRDDLLRLIQWQHEAEQRSAQEHSRILDVLLGRRH